MSRNRSRLHPLAIQARNADLTPEEAALLEVSQTSAEEAKQANKSALLSRIPKAPRPQKKTFSPEIPTGPRIGDPIMSKGRNANVIAIHRGRMQIQFQDDRTTIWVSPIGLPIGRKRELNDETYDVVMTRVTSDDKLKIRFLMKHFGVSSAEAALDRCVKLWDDRDRPRLRLLPLPSKQEGQRINPRLSGIMGVCLRDGAAGYPNRPSILLRGIMLWVYERTIYDKKLAEK